MKVTDKMVETACVDYYGDSFSLWSLDGKESARKIIRHILEAGINASDEKNRVEEAELIIGRLMGLIMNIRGWVMTGYSETATLNMDDAVEDGWARMGWRAYLDKWSRRDDR